MVRRYYHGNDFATSFQNTVENIIVLKLLQIEIVPGAVIQPGRSNSGTILKENFEKIDEIPLDLCLWRAAELFIQFGTLLNEDLSQAVNQSIEGVIDKIKISTLQFIISTYDNKKENFRSTANLRINTTSGYTFIKSVQNEKKKKTFKKMMKQACLEKIQYHFKKDKRIGKDNKKQNKKELEHFETRKFEIISLLCQLNKFQYTRTRERQKIIIF